MTTLKAIKNRKKSVQSTKKITLAMKMVAGAKLRRAEEEVKSARPYAHMMECMIKDLSKKSQSIESPQPLLTGSGKRNIHLIIVTSSNRGLCGGFNSSIIKKTKEIIKISEDQGQVVKLFCIGNKAYDMLANKYKKNIIQKVSEIGIPRLDYSDVQKIACQIINRFEKKEFDLCTIIFSKYISAMNQEINSKQIIPIQENSNIKKEKINKQLSSIYQYEPSEIDVLSKVLPRNIGVQIFISLLENAASEQGARMTAMDSASRNAEEMIKKLALTYNRTRQAQITKELIEIISGAEAI